MNFFITMGILCILLAVNVETKLSKCRIFNKAENQKKLTYHFGYVCTKSSCDWAVDSKCKSGTSSKVLKWETDIFEIGFQKQNLRPRKILVKIDLNKDYYIVIKIISDNVKKTLKIILEECSHTKKNCLENKKFTLNDPNVTEKYAIAAIGFRRDKKINFVGMTEANNRASTFFSQKNELELRMKGFYFNTKDTMKITVSSTFDKNFKYDGFLMTLPTSVGGYIFNKDGYLVHNGDYGCGFYSNPNEGEGIPYILKSYYKNSENWKTTPVKHTVEWIVPYFDENGMKFTSEQMKIKEVKNPYFDETKMKRKDCKYVELKTEEALPGEEQSIPMDILLPPEPSEITIADELLKKKTDFMQPNINITEFIERVGGNKSLHQDYLSNVGKGGDDFKVKVLNGSEFPLHNYVFANPPKKEEKTTTTTTTKKTEGGSGGAGDASRGQKQAKIIPPKYFVILILMILSV